MREIVPMDKTSLKAREIEALTFLFANDAPSGADAGTSPRRSWFTGRPATVGLAAAFVVIAALALLVFSA